MRPEDLPSALATWRSLLTLNLLRVAHLFNLEHLLRLGAKELNFVCRFTAFFSVWLWKSYLVCPDLICFSFICRYEMIFSTVHPSHRFLWFRVSLPLKIYSDWLLLIWITYGKFNAASKLSGQSVWLCYHKYVWLQLSTSRFRALVFWCLPKCRVQYVSLIAVPVQKPTV